MQRPRFITTLALIVTLLVTACGSQQPHIAVPAISDIIKVTIGGGLPGSSSATLTQSQNSSVLAMLKKAQDRGTVKPVSGGYPPAMSIHMTNGRTIIITPSEDVKKQGNSETGVAVKGYVNFYDSNDKSNKPQKLYAPDLYNFLTKWRQEIPKSQWKRNG